MTADPNVNAEIYRSVDIKVNCWNKLGKICDFLEIFDDNTTLLCSNDLVGRIQNSSIALFTSPNELLDSNPFTTLHEDITVSAAAFITKSVILAAEDTGLLKLCTTNSYNGKNDTLIAVLKISAHHDIITSVTKLPNSSNCVTAGNDLEIKVWDTNYLEDQFIAIHTFHPAHRDNITGVAVNPGDANIFASCSTDRTALLWDLRKHEPATGLFKSEYALKCIEWQRDSTIIALGDCDGAVMLVDIRCPGTAFKKVQSFETELHKIRFCPTGPNLLAMCADNSIVKVIDVDKDNPECTIYEQDLHTNIVRGLAWDRLTKTFYTCGYDNKILSHIINQ